MILKHLHAAMMACGLVTLIHAQPSEPIDRPPGGPGPGFGPPGMQQELKVVSKFDQDGDKRLNSDERKKAREFVKQERAKDGGRRGPRRRPGGEEDTPVVPGPKVSLEEARAFPGAPLYASNVVRTLFLQFENTDWEKELSDFHNTDVDVPARLTVDGKSYPDVGVRFRGASSYFMIQEGRKRSLNLSLDYYHKDQNLLGARTLNLLNSHEDPSFLRGVLYAQIARDYIAAPQANFVKLVVNGEYWGVYISSEQFNKDFTKANFGSAKGSRWKVTGSPRGGGSLAYIGEDFASYKRIYDIKTKDDAKAWADLVKLCKTIDQAPTNQLIQLLAPQLDIDGALKFLALENALINNDGYWIRTSDYSLYEDENGRFHIVPHDTNETFARPGGPGFGGPGGGPGMGGPDRRINRGTNAVARRDDGPGNMRDGSGQGRRQGGGPQVKGVELDPLMAATDAHKPLISKLLAVPELRTRYMGYVRDIAERWLDWNKLGPIATNYHALIAADVKLDTRKLDSTEDFEKSLTTDISGRGFGPGGGGTMALKAFADQRRAYLLSVTAAQK